MENNYTVYIHIFPNNKVYVGITMQTVYKRWKNRYSNSPFMNNAIQKYGWENIEHKILYEHLTKEEAEQKEMELIKEYKSNQRKFGYNIANGGNHQGKHSEETKQKIKNSGASKTFFKKGEPSWNKGLKMSPETVEKNRLTHLGKKQSAETKIKISKSLNEHIVTQETIDKIQETRRKNYPNGFKHSKKTIEKIRNKNIGKKQSAETKKKRSKTMKKKYKNGYINPMKGKKAVNRKPIIQLDMNNNFIREWECISDAAKYYNINASRIVLVLKGMRNQTLGYMWKYKTEYNVANAIFG